MFDTDKSKVFAAMEKKKNGRCFIFSPFLLLFVG
jgi:hypothetical protein